MQTRSMPAGARKAREAERRLADVACAAIGALALIAWTLAGVLAAQPTDEDTQSARAMAGAASEPPVRSSGRELVLGAYGGGSSTQRSEVHIVDPGRTDMTVRDFDWLGRPFKSPIYYGLRAQRWWPGSPVGAMLDFTHAKAIAKPDDEASLSGQRDGKPLPPKAKIGETFRHLEFSHGHNLLTLNGVVRMPMASGRVRPYVGAGAGILLPHTEVGFRDEEARTYEYQYGGVVAQALIGIEVPLGRVSAFFEYKFSHALYDVPLSHERKGHLLVTDVWRQLRAWLAGEAPPGGRLSTALGSHHGIGGLYVRVNR